VKLQDEHFQVNIVDPFSSSGTTAGGDLVSFAEVPIDASESAPGRIVSVVNDAIDDRYDVT